MRPVGPVGQVSGTRCYRARRVPLSVPRSAPSSQETGSSKKPEEAGKAASSRIVEEARRWPRVPPWAVWLAGAIVLGAVVGTALWVRGSRAQTGETGPGDQAGLARVLAAAPADSWLIATLDVAAAQPLLEPWLESLGGLSGATRVAGLGSLSSACGFEPLEHVRQVMVALPERGDQRERGEFGFAVATDAALGAGELAACARKVIAARGGTPTTTTRGGFQVISAGAAALAYRKGGPFLVGRGSWLDAMIDAAEGKGPGASPEHGALRAMFQAGAGPQGAGARALPALQVTALLPESLREGLRAEVAGDAGPGQGRATLGVLGVGEAAAAVMPAAGAGGVTTLTTLAVDLRCDSAAACDDVKSLVERARLAWAGDVALRLSGLGPLIDSVTVESLTLTSEGRSAPDGRALAIRAHAPTADLAGALARLLDRLSPPPSP
jgi:hypothetical protein